MLIIKIKYKMKTLNRLAKKFVLLVLIIAPLLTLYGSEKERLPYKLKVGTYNVGHFNQGSLGGFQWEGKRLKAELNNWRRWIGEQGLDVLSLNEWNHFFDKDSMFVASDELLKPYYKNVYMGGNQNWIYNGFATNYSLKNLQQIDLFGDYYALVGDLIIDGVVIKLITVHIPWQEKWHDESIDNLIALLKQYEYFICMGDMNAKDSNQQKFIESGFNMANGGAMGWFTTSQSSIESAGYSGGENVNIDNIITSSNIKIMRVNAPKTGLNDLDHLPIIADLIITW